jgi:hypothetical protein
VRGGDHLLAVQVARRVLAVDVVLADAVRPAAVRACPWRRGASCSLPRLAKTRHVFAGSCVPARRTRTIGVRNAWRRGRPSARRRERVEAGGRCAAAEDHTLTLLLCLAGTCQPGWGETVGPAACIADPVGRPRSPRHPRLGGAPRPRLQEGGEVVLVRGHPRGLQGRRARREGPRRAVCAKGRGVPAGTHRALAQC